MQKTQTGQRQGNDGTGALQGLLDRLNVALERRIPEQRLFLKSAAETRFVRLRPLTQVVTFGGAGLVLGWTIIASSILLMDSIGAGSLREQAQRDQFVYEARLNGMAAERDQRAEEARQAQDRFNVALERISDMQSALLASEERRKEMETGIEVIQATLRRTMRERDAARGDVAELRDEIYAENGGPRSDRERADDMDQTVQFLTAALDHAATERDEFSTAAAQSQQEADHMALEMRLMEDRNNLIFSRLEEAVSVSMAPLEKVFRDAGLPPERILQQVRSGYVSEEDRLTRVSISSSGSLEDPAEARVNGILDGLEEVNHYRIAAQMVPFAEPVRDRVRHTSGFGTRRHPISGRNRMHEGIDLAGPSGTAIHATSDGVVKKAGWQGGYGNAVTIEHAFGIETHYAHLSRIDVKAGQRVSRGDRIGGMGTTGQSTGVHLHYEVRVGGTPVNPMTYIRAARNVF